MQVESAFDNGTHVLDQNLEVTPVHPLNRGSIGVDVDGVNPCLPVVSVESTTWGRLKSHFR